uniref:Putative secreted protein n=1 Tax=Ixodes ricinus TaxID=34613 RepID=A0A6B0UAC4_IXORI
MSFFHFLSLSAAWWRGRPRVTGGRLSVRFREVAALSLSMRPLWSLPGRALALPPSLSHRFLLLPAATPLRALRRHRKGFSGGFFFF